MSVEVDLNQYDHVIVAYSGGKDSTACLLHLMDQGVDMKKVEVWHHLVDGRGDIFMDWPSTEDYCRKFAQTFEIPLYYSWRHQGFRGELMKKGRPSHHVEFECPDGSVRKAGGKRARPGTRLRFPQQSPNPMVRWCTAYLKIDVYRMALRNQARFLNKKTLIVTGERAEESASRAQYAEFEPDDTDNRDGSRRVRWVDRLRPIHGWTEERVWQIMEAHSVQPHPAYRIGWGRLSCMGCIFGSDRQWKSFQVVDPESFDELAELEQSFDMTIDRKQRTLIERIEGVQAYEKMQASDIEEALSSVYTGQILTDNWKLPMGAFGDLSGPT